VSACTSFREYNPTASVFPKRNALLFSCAPFAPDESNQKLAEVALNIYLKFGKRIDALRCSIMMNRMDLVRKIFIETEDL